MITIAWPKYGGRNSLYCSRITVAKQKPIRTLQPWETESCGVPHYLRARTVGTHPAFIDGLADLVCAEHGGALRWYRNEGEKGAPKFGEPILIPNEGADGPRGYLRVCASDLNGDGKPDLLIGAVDAKRQPGFWVLHQK